jgi:phage gp37-like protein
MADPITAIENAVLARAKAAEPRFGYSWQTCETYPADWDAFLKEKRQVNAPGLWFGYAGGRSLGEEVIEGGGYGTRIELAFGLTVLAKHFGNEEMRRQGNAAQKVVGAYELMLNCISLFDGYDLGLDIDNLEFGQLRLVRPVGALTEMKAAMYAVQVTTSILIPRLPADLGAGPLDDFERFHTNWDLPPFGGIDANPGAPGVQVPDDAHADAIDHLELPQ